MHKIHTAMISTLSSARDENPALDAVAASPGLSRPFNPRDLLNTRCEERRNHHHNPIQQHNMRSVAWYIGGGGGGGGGIGVIKMMDIVSKLLLLLLLTKFFFKFAILLCLSISRCSLTFPDSSSLIHSTARAASG